MDPTTTIIRELTDPINTYRAESIAQMISIATGVSVLDIVYKIGIPSTISNTYAIRNNTIAHVLEIEVNLPTYLQMDIPSKILLNPLEIIRFKVTVDEANIPPLIHTGRDVFNDQVRITTIPLNVTGPVLVSKRLTPLTV